jgi:hypothetical protein
MSKILGAVLAVLGALRIVSLRPQITVTPQEPLTSGDVFSVPFRITNTGYLSFYVPQILLPKFRGGHSEASGTELVYLGRATADGLMSAN